MLRMTVILPPFASTENGALEYLLSHCWPTHIRFCPRCSEEKIYALSGGRYRCAHCRYTFQDFSGRWVNNGALSAQNWLRLVECFCREMTVQKMAEELALSYNATYKAVTTLRFAILAHAVDVTQLLGGETGLGEYLQRRKLTGVPPVKGGGPVPVFGIMERNGWVFIDLVSGLSTDTILHFNHNFHLAVMPAGNLLYTSRYRNYDALTVCCPDSSSQRYLRKYDTAPIEQGAFFSFAAPFLRRFKGISPQRFPLYLKELEFRFNHRSGDMFDALVGYLCDIVPEMTK